MKLTNLTLFPHIQSHAKWCLTGAFEGLGQPAIQRRLIGSLAPLIKAIETVECNSKDPK